jgi:hypothetical protein
MVLALAGVLIVKQLLQADDVCALLRRLTNSQERLLDIGFLGLRAAHLHAGDFDTAVFAKIVWHGSGNDQ